MSTTITEQQRKLNLNMRSILPPCFKHMLWKDELGEDFVLTKSGEIYRYGQNELRAILWSFTKSSQMQERRARLEHRTDDGLFLLNFPVSELQNMILLLGMFRKRPDIKGAWVKDKQARLAHQVIAYRPNLAEDESQIDSKPAPVAVLGPNSCVWPKPGSRQPKPTERLQRPHGSRKRPFSNSHENDYPHGEFYCCA